MNSTKQARSDGRIVRRFGADDIASFGQRIRMLREARGWSVQRLAKEAGLSVIAIRGLESGQADPRLRSALSIAEALGEPIDRLVATARAASVSVRLVRREEQPSPPPGQVSLAEVTGELHEPRMQTEVVRFGVGARIKVPTQLVDRPTFCYVLEGTVTVTFGDGEAVELEEGDSIHFMNERRVDIANVRRTSAKILRVIDLMTEISRADGGRRTKNGANAK
jgi:transcriptional regulator with XRE-family HTH domain